MTCQTLFSEKNKKKIINLLSAEFAYRVLKVKSCLSYVILYSTSAQFNTVQSHNVIL